MSETLIEELRTENLCTYFVLPLLKLNKISFVKSNFIDCFLSFDRKLLAVKVYNDGLLSRKVYSVPEYAGKVIREDGFLYVIFNLPYRWKRDVTLFSEGKFSQISEEAKNLIRTYSGLKYRVPNRYGQTETDGRLLALDRDPILREMWEKMYNVILVDEDELLSIPGPKSYLEYPEHNKPSLL